jgi:hypothetical protein
MTMVIGPTERRDSEVVPVAVATGSLIAMSAVVVDAVVDVVDVALTGLRASSSWIEWVESVAVNGEHRGDWKTMKIEEVVHCFEAMSIH